MLLALVINLAGAGREHAVVDHDRGDGDETLWIHTMLGFYVRIETSEVVTMFVRDDVAVYAWAHYGGSGDGAGRIVSSLRNVTVFFPNVWVLWFQACHHVDHGHGERSWTQFITYATVKFSVLA